MKVLFLMVKLIMLLIMDVLLVKVFVGSLQVL